MVTPEVGGEGPRPAPSPVARRIFRGISSSVVMQAITACQPILLVPWYLRAWGQEGYGEWLTLNAVAAYMILLDLGSSTYLGNSLADCHARGDREAFRSTLSRLVSLSFVFGLTACLVLVVGVTVAHYVAVPGLDRTLTASESTVLGFLGANVLVLALPGGVYATVYRATGLFARGAMVGNIFRLLLLGAMVVMLLLRVSPETFAAGILLGGLACTLGVLLDSRRVIPDLRGLPLSLRHALSAVRYLRESIFFWLFSMAQTLVQQGMILVLAATSLPVAVAVYATHRTAASVANYVAAVVQGPLWPELTFLSSRREWTRLEAMTLRATRGVVLAIALVACLVWIGAPIVFPWWTGRQVELGPVLLGLLLAQGLLSAAWTVPSWVLMAANRQHRVSVYYICVSVLALGGAVLTSRRWGAEGIAVAGLASELACLVVVPAFMVAPFLGVARLKMLGHAVLSLLLAAPVMALAGAAVTWLPGWAGVAAFAPVALAGLYVLFRVIRGGSRGAAGDEPVPPPDVAGGMGAGT